MDEIRQRPHRAGERPGTPTPRTATTRSRTDRSLAAQVARRFYLDDETKVAIADEFGISRFKVARLLEYARSTGIVTITLRDDGIPDERLAERLGSHLGLDECVVVGSHGDDDEVRAQVGAAAAHLLESTLDSGDVLGLSWGRTLSALTGQLRSLPSVTVVQLTGAAGGDLSDSPIEVVRRAAASAGGLAYAFYLPLYVRDERTATALRQQPEVAAAMRMFEEITVAVVSVGSWDPPVTQLFDLVEPDLRERLLRAGAVADIAGILLDANGNPVDEGFVGRSLTVRIDQMRAIPRVVAVAAGAQKAQAIVAATRTGMVSGLVTDRALAEAVLRNQPDVP